MTRSAHESAATVSGVDSEDALQRVSRSAHDGLLEQNHTYDAALA
jgi:hypothetical protein